MTIGFELDEQFAGIEQRLARLEGNKDEPVLDIEADLTAQIDRLETELNDRIDDLENFDLDELRYDLEAACDEDEVENIVERVLDDVLCERVTDAVCEEVNSRAVSYIEWTRLVDRVKELEDRLNKPSLSGRIVRWLREGPSIKEVATNWYAGIRRGS